MKKGVLIFIFLVCFSFLFATSSQKVYRTTDDVWQLTDKLCRLNGVLGPTPVSPTTEAEIKIALNRLNYSTLSQYSKQIYDEILAKFDERAGWSYEDNDLILDPSIKFNPQIYDFNNKQDTYKDEFFMPYKDRDQFVILDLEISLKDRAYLYGQYTFMDDLVGFKLNTDGIQELGDLFHNYSNFSTLMNFALNGDFIGTFSKDKNNYTTGFFTHHPMKAGLSIGNDYMNFVIGRFRQSFGNGITGNLIIGDNFSYQELMKLSFFTNVFTYNLSLTHYDNADYAEPVSFQFCGYHQSRTIQRLDFSFFDKVRFTANIGAHLYTPTMFDWRMVMPMMLVHNWFNYHESTTLNDGDEMNNILGCEIEWVINNNFTVSAQIALDQFQMFLEKGSKVPNAYGALVNLKMVTPTSKGIFDTYIECLYTNPYLYLNYKTDSDGNQIYVLDHIAGYYWYMCKEGEVNYLGHSFGPDTIAIALGTTFDSFADWKLSGNILLKAHGEHGIKKDYWNQIQDIKDINNSNKANTPSGIPEYTLQIDVASEYKLTSNISLNAALMNRWQWNYHNNLGINKYSIQSSFGMKWNIC